MDSRRVSKLRSQPVNSCTHDYHGSSYLYLERGSPFETTVPSPRQHNRKKTTPLNQ